MNDEDGNDLMKYLRRRFLQSSAALALASAGGRSLLAQADDRKPVAGVVTIYRKNSHADVLIGKILEGWKQDGGAGPRLKLVSLYVDQFPADDLSVALAKKHGFRLCKSIDEALTLGTQQLAVEGVLSIGEHGDYPHNAKGQHLYPRRRFFEEITDTMRRTGKVVPVFNDKHPGPELADMLWIAARAKELQLPWMAGSSLPVGYRDPDVTLPMGAPLEAIVGVGYSGLDVYGFHTLDVMQSIFERRAPVDGGTPLERGVRSVQCLPIKSLGQFIEDKTIHLETLDAALQSSQVSRQALLDSPPTDGVIFLIEYRDGWRVPVLMLPTMAKAISVGFKAKHGPVRATRAEEREEPRYPHFACLLKGIERMILTGQPAYPAERTLLTSGMLDRLLTSRHQDGQKLSTPELAIEYKPVDYPHGNAIVF